MAQAIYAAFKALERANGPVEPSITVEESEDLLSRLHAADAADMEALHGSLLRKSEVWMQSRLSRVGQRLNDRLVVYFDLDDMGDLKRWSTDEPLVISASVTRSTDDPDLLFSTDPDSVSSVSLPKVSALGLQDSYVSELLSGLMSDLNEDRMSGQENMIGRRTSSLLAECLWHEHLASIRRPGRSSPLFASGAIRIAGGMD